MASAPTASTEVRITWVHRDDLHPNPWNPNAMDPEMLIRATESIHDFGFIDPITCREAKYGLEIIDGEHRWRVAATHGRCVREPGEHYFIRHIGLDTLPVISLGKIPDAEAKQLTVILNEVRGQANPEKLGVLLKDLLATETKERLLARLPYSMEALDRLTGLPTLDWGGLDSGRPHPQGAVERPTSWVERTYRMPQDAAEVLDRAIAKWRESEADDGSSSPDWRALELICADWLAGA